MNSVDVFERLAERLIDLIPQSVAGLHLSDPVCCLRVYYYDTHAPCAYLLLKPVGETFRSKLLADEGPSALFYLWASGEEKGDAVEISIGEREADSDTAALFQSAYRLLAEDEDRFMMVYRATLQRVCYQLNSLDWNQFCRVTDDFAVVAADGSQFFCDELNDITNSIPPARLHLIRLLGLLGPGEHWDRRRGFTYGEEKLSPLELRCRELEDRADTLSVPKRIDYWIEQLDRMAGGASSDIPAGINAHFPIQNLARIGNEAIIPMLKFAIRWADMVEWDCDNEETAKLIPTQKVVVFVLWKVKEMGYTDRQVELLLREFLDRSCLANEGRSLWGFLPFHCADCLHALFDRYPEPKMAENEALENRADFLNIPLP